MRVFVKKYYLELRGRKCKQRPTISEAPIECGSRSPAVLVRRLSPAILCRWKTTVFVERSSDSLKKRE